MFALRIRLCVLSLLLLFCLCGCEAKEKYFAPLDGAFVADVEGTYGEIAFSARLCVDAPCKGEAVRRATLIFYAPSALKGTTLCRDADGALSLSVGDLVVSAPEAYGALFSFLEARDVSSVMREGENARVVCKESSFLFAKDGTPLEATGGSVSVKILSFSKNEG